MKALKAAVIVMGILIAVGFVFVAATIVRRMTSDPAPPVKGSVLLDAGSGCSLADAWSADGFLYLRTAGEGSCQAVLVFDPKTQEQVGRIGLDAAAPSLD